MPAQVLAMQGAMVATAEKWVDTVAEKMKLETAHQMLQDYIREMLRQGTLPTMQVIATARRLMFANCRNLLSRENHWLELTVEKHA